MVPWWTQERLDELKARHADGATAGEIAYAMRTTRNAVIGKLARLGLRTHRAQPQVTNRARRRRRRPVPMIKIAALPAMRATDLPLDQFAHPKSLIALGADECHWPGRGSPATEFCAEPVYPGRPYCARHTLAAYTRIIPKVVR